MLSNNMPSLHTLQFDSGHSAAANLDTGSTMTVKQGIDCGGHITCYDILFTAPHGGKFTYHFKNHVRIAMETEYWVEDEQGNIYRPENDRDISVLDLEESDVRKDD